MKPGQELEDVFVQERVTVLDRRMHGDAITLGLQKQARQHDAAAKINRAIEGVPARHALSINPQIVIRTMAGKKFLEFPAEETQPRHGHQAVDVEPGVRTAERLESLPVTAPG